MKTIVVHRGIVIYLKVPTSIYTTLTPNPNSKQLDILNTQITSSQMTNLFSNKASH